MDTNSALPYRLVDATPDTEVADIADQESFTELAVNGKTLYSPRAVSGAALAAAHGLAHLARGVDSDYALGSPEQASAVLDAAHDIAVSLERLVQGTSRWLGAAGDRGEVTGDLEETFERLQRAQAAVKAVPRAVGEAADEVRAMAGSGTWGIRKQAAGVAKLLKERDATLLLEYVQDIPDMLPVWQIQFRLPGDARTFEVTLSDNDFGSLPWPMEDFDVHPGTVAEWVLGHLNEFVFQDAAQQVCELSKDELTLLGHIHRAGRPVEAGSFFEEMNTETGERATERQVELFQTYVSVWKRHLIRAVVPADGSNADKMMLTGSGEASLNAAGGL
ncbi:hypothetical protein [Nocardiopsis sp. JB363]|uniref:hypothetical protein n=1 Tax=Nocardiopsis sp. JB363 TaxID=1434837 RepID=UPI00097B70A7|nr:hypothetical protein [Nocardiopsis sp. JB363]SIO86473.1 hypothetical protein BQ8420_12180 [Nocardiopsis sp. JB363]